MPKLKDKSDRRAPSENDAFWLRVRKHGETLPLADRMCLDQMEFRSFDGKTLKLSIKKGAGPFTPYVAKQGPKVSALARLAAGTDVAVVFEPDSAEPAPGLIAEKLTAEYQRLASGLSDRLKDLEIRLRNRTAQVQAEVEFDNVGEECRLCWIRHEGEWKLWVWDIPTAQEVEEAEGPGMLSGTRGRALLQSPLEEKAAAAHAIPHLLKAINKAETQKIEELRDAHTVLDEAWQQMKAGGLA